MSFIYKTIYFAGNPKAEYQKRGKDWYKRARGSKNDFYIVDPDGSKTLDKAYASKGSLYFYSDTFKVGVGLVLGGIAYFLYKRTMKQVGGDKKPLTILKKPNVSGQPTT